MNKEDDDYQLIPMSEITDEARRLSVDWMECEDKNWIGNKHKLASDIMNYARRYHEQKLKQDDWVNYSWENRGSHPPKPDRYLIYREKCDKMHFEQWNGSGWASSNGDCSHYKLPKKPIK